MSKHLFDQKVGDTKYEVQIGWDRPLQRFYFVISPYIVDKDFGEITDDPVASNLNLPNPTQLTLEQIKAVCEDYGLVLPLDILANVDADRIRDAVNEIKVY
jgi:hypothetical protein